MKGKIWGIFFVIISQYADAQIVNFDTLKNSFFQNPSPIVGFHNRNTFIRTENVLLKGFVLGADFDKKYKLYLGFYGFPSSNKILLAQSPLIGFDSVSRSIRMRYFCLGFDHTVFQKNRWTITNPIHLGIGKSKFILTNQKDEVLSELDFRQIPLEFGINTYFDIVPALALNGEAGYRLVMGKKEVRNLSAPFYSFGLIVRLGIIYDYLKKPLNLPELPF